MLVQNTRGPNLKPTQHKTDIPADPGPSSINCSSLSLSTLYLRCAFSVFLTPGIHMPSLPKKSLPSSLFPISNYFTIFNLPFAAKPSLRVIYMHSHHFLPSHSLTIPLAILIPRPPYRIETDFTNGLPDQRTSPRSFSLGHQSPLMACFPLNVTLSCFSSSPSHSICSSVLGLLPLNLCKLFIYYLIYSDSSSHNFFQISPKSVFPSLASLQGSRLPSDIRLLNQHFP